MLEEIYNVENLEVAIDLVVSVIQVQLKRSQR
jgi:hypothetical protein